MVQARQELGFNPSFNPPTVRDCRASLPDPLSRCSHPHCTAGSGAARLAHSVGGLAVSNSSFPASGCSVLRAGTSDGPGNASTHARKVRSRPQPSFPAPNCLLMPCTDPLPVPLAHSFDAFATFHGHAGRRRGRRRSGLCGGRAPSACGAARGRPSARAARFAGTSIFAQNGPFRPVGAHMRPMCPKAAS